MDLVRAGKILGIVLGIGGIIFGPFLYGSYHGIFPWYVTVFPVVFFFAPLIHKPKEYSGAGASTAFLMILFYLFCWLLLFCMWCAVVYVIAQNKVPMGP